MAKKNNLQDRQARIAVGTGVASFICGLVAIPATFLTFKMSNIGMFIAGMAIIFGIWSIVMCANTGESKRFAISGLIIGTLYMMFDLFVTLFFVPDFEMRFNDYIKWRDSTDRIYQDSLKTISNQYDSILNREYQNDSVFYVN